METSQQRNQVVVNKMLVFLKVIKMFGDAQLIFEQPLLQIVIMQ